MVKPAITVLMAVHDTPAPMLAQAVDSILAQTYREFEFLILDDGSGDAGTRAQLASIRDRRVRVLWEPHRGLTRTLNRGLARAEGRLIARQDADDWSEPDRLEKQAAYLDEHRELALCGSDAWMHRHDGRRLWRMRLPCSAAEIRDALPSRNPFVHGAAMFRRAEAIAAGGYREEFPCSQDYDLFWRLSDRWGAANLPEALYHYRYTGGSVSASRAADQAIAHAAARILARARAGGEAENARAALAEARSEAEDAGVFHAELKQADHRLLAGEFRDAGREYLRLLRSHPQSALAWMKLARWGVYTAIPPARAAAFKAHA